MFVETDKWKCQVSVSYIRAWGYTRNKDLGVGIKVDTQSPILDNSQNEKKTRTL